MAKGQISQGYPTTPETASFVALGNRLLVGDGYGPNFFVVNAATGRVISAVMTPSKPTGGSMYADPFSFAPDDQNGLLYVGTYSGNISVLNLTSMDVVGVINGTSSSILSIVPQAHRLFAGEYGGSSIKVINLSSNRISSTLAAPGGLFYSFCYDARANTLVDIDGSGTAHFMNATTLRQTATLASGIDTTYSNGETGTPVFCDTSNSQVYFFDIYPNGSGIQSSIKVVDPYTATIVSTIAIGSGGSSITYVAVDPATQNLYVGNTENGILVLNGTTNSIIGNVSGPYVTGLALSTVSHELLGVEEGRAIFVYNCTRGLVVGAPSMVVRLWGSAYDPDNGHLYVGAENQSVSVFDPTTTPHQIGSLPSEDGSSWITVDTPDHEVFVSNAHADCLTVIDDQNDSVLRRCLVVGAAPLGSAFDPVNHMLYVANADNVTIVNASSLAVVKTIVLGPSGAIAPTDVAFDSRDGLVFVANYVSGNLSVIQASTNALLAPPKWSVGLGGPDVLQYDSANGYLYVGNWYASNISVLNASTATGVASINLSAGPLALTLDASAGLLFSADGGSNFLSIISTTTNTKAQTDITVGSEPAGVAYVPTSDQVDVSDLRTGVLSVLADVPRITTLAAEPEVDDVGIQATLNATVTLGAPPYSYRWTGLPPSCPPSNSPILSCFPNQVGDFSLSLTVTDARNYSWWDTIPFRVVPTLRVSSFDLSRNESDVGVATWFNLTTSGGTGKLDYYYSGLPGGCSSANVSALECLPLVEGKYVVVATATDSLGLASSSIASFIVERDPVLASFIVNPATAHLGDAVSFNAFVDGGTGPFTYSYTGLPSSCPAENASSFSCLVATSGTFDVGVRVTDSLRESATATGELVVERQAVPPGPQILAFIADPPELTLGESLTLVVTVSNGSGTLAYSFYGLPAGCSTDSSPQLRCTPIQTGNFTIRVVVADLLDRYTSSNTTLSVLKAAKPPPPPSATRLTQNQPWFDWVEIAAVSALVGGVVSAVVFETLRRNRPPR